MRETPNNLSVPLNFPQQPMLIEHPVGIEVVTQRPMDGYINATELCQRAGKRFNNYHQTAQTKPFLEELSAVTGIPVTGQTGLVQIIGGNDKGSHRADWVHPKGIHGGHWLSPATQTCPTSGHSTG